RQGRLWQEESFDCIVRSDAQLEKYACYIRQNPTNAGLPEGEFRLGAGLNVEQASRLSGERVSARSGSDPSAPASPAVGGRDACPTLLRPARRRGAGREAPGWLALRLRAANEALHREQDA